MQVYFDRLNLSSFRFLCCGFLHYLKTNMKRVFIVLSKGSVEFWKQFLILCF